ncbi:FDLD family class I lanthipeptide [Paenibacillus tyrfis]|uniref:FDLD family class I lanthipeptide n=1 Tax=Paenibacillus tyrfis TaxID=1501230 RepID=UPI001378F490|nr:FDLD family class I lanthipeptide [Paenibacillus tyrfis]
MENKVGAVMTNDDFDLDVQVLKVKSSVTHPQGTTMFYQCTTLCVTITIGCPEC